MSEKEKAILIEILLRLLDEVESHDKSRWAFETFNPIRTKLNTLAGSFTGVAPL